MELQTIFYSQCAVTMYFCRWTKIPLLQTDWLSAYNDKTNDTGNLCLATILQCKEYFPNTRCIFLNKKKILAYIVSVPWLNGSSVATHIVLVKHVVTLDSSRLALQSPVVTICTTRFNTQQFHILPTHCIYVFCVYLRTNSDHFPIQH